MLSKTMHFLTCTFMAASLAFAAGCNSSSSGSSDDSGSNALPVGGNNISGPADPVQDGLSQVGDGAGGAPVIGDTAEALVSSLISLLDVPDGLASGFQGFMLTQDPQDLMDGGELAGDALLSFSAGLSETLIQLTEEGYQIPGLDTLLPTLEALQHEVQDGITGETDGGDLSAVTDLLEQVAAQLYQVSQQVPPDVQDAPLVGDLLAALGGGAFDLVSILDAVGRLDGEDTSVAMVGAFQGLAATLSGALPGGAGAQLDAAVAQAVTTFEGGLALLLDPLFQALRGVLAPVTGENAPLAGILASLMSGDITSLGGFDGLASLLAGGGLSVPLLSDQLAGLPLLGDLLGTVLGQGGGLPLLGNILENGGTGGLPLLGDLLQGLPGLSQPGSSAPLSLPLVGDLLTTLLSLDGNGVPVIGSILEAGTGSNGGLDLPVVGGLLDGLLGNLLGQAGGIDSTGGFLDGLGGIPVLGPVLDSILGGLLGGLLG